jgi:hypothetical protein
LKRKDVKKKGKLTMENVLSKALREFMSGPLNQLLVNLSGKDGAKWEKELNKFNRKEPCWVDKQVELARAESRILKYIGEVTIPATVEKFVARDNFKLKKDGGICSCLGDTFVNWFLSGEGKIEDQIGEQTLRYAELRQSSVDIPIINELGGEAKAETTLSEMFSLMKEQKNGRCGVLLSNGYANVFYIGDISGVLRAVLVVWSGVGWRVCADSVERPRTWRDGYLVFSRN